MLYAVSKVIGDGTETIVPGEENTTGPFRPRASIHGSYVAVIIDGFDWCLVKLVGDEDGAKNDGGLIVLPDLDRGWTAQEANLGNLRLAQNGLPGDLIVEGMTTEGVVNAVGNWLVPGWSLAYDFGVAGQ